MSFKFNPFTGNLDIVGGGSADNFSYTTIPEGDTVTVPVNQQMLYYGDLTINGDLVIDGDIVEIRDDSYQTMPVSHVLAGELYLVPANRVLFFKNLTIDGDLRIDGDLVEV